MDSIFLAARAGHIPAVKQFLAAGVDHFARDEHDETALWYACSCGHPVVTELLLEDGAEWGPECMSIALNDEVRAVLRAHPGSYHTGLGKRTADGHVETAVHTPHGAVGGRGHKPHGAAE